jgi:molybdopterin converting factor small subunit
MLVQVKLMATLRSKLPPDARGGTVTLDLGAGATVQSVLDHFGIASGHVHIVLVNDAMETERGRTLAEGDNLVILPPVAGG